MREYHIGGALGHVSAAGHVNAYVSLDEGHSIITTVTAKDISGRIFPSAP